MLRTATTPVAEASPQRSRFQTYSLLRRQGAWKDALRRRMLATSDVVAVLGAALVGGLAEDSTATVLWSSALLPLWLFLAKAHGLYELDHTRIRHSTIDELSSLLHWVTLSLAATGVFLASVHTLSAASAVAMWAAALPLAVLGRVAARALWRRVVPPERGLVLGGGQLSEALIRKLALEPGHHLCVAASMELAQPGSGNGALNGGGNGTKPHEKLDSLEQMIVNDEIERVVIATQDLDEVTVSSVVSSCRAVGVKLSVAPPLRAMFGTAVNLNHIAELPLIEFKTWDPSRSTMALKRVMDVVGSGLALVLLLPFMALIAAAIRLDSRGPALFVQSRAGRNGAPFRMYKFRTMVKDAADRLDELIDTDELADPMYKLRGDPRVTRFGGLLRALSLDELPQLFNVVRGDMSLVGPRPEETWLVERYVEAQLFRLEMRPGMTGPMQVHGRGELTFQERLAVEREYIENYSFQKDLKILFTTLGAVLWRRGAF